MNVMKSHQGSMRGNLRVVRDPRTETVIHGLRRDAAPEETAVALATTGLPEEVIGRAMEHPNGCLLSDLSLAALKFIVEDRRTPEEAGAILMFPRSADFYRRNAGGSGEEIPDNTSLLDLFETNALLALMLVEGEETAHIQHG